jgi:divalent metal cation (Fe/Co/Zn/Cd) transporter
MKQLVHIGVQPTESVAVCAPKGPRTRIFWLQGVTLVWMAVEFGVAAYGAATAHSPALLAFGSDSLVELMSAAVVLLQWTPNISSSERTAARTASALLFALALIVVVVALSSLVFRQRPESSCAGVGITVAALVAMPILASMKRHEARRLGNAALAADATQSATCAYLAVIALTGLSVNALFHIAWFDSAAALIAVPVLLKEGRSAWKGKTCKCC